MPWVRHCNLNLGEVVRVGKINLAHRAKPQRWLLPSREIVPSHFWFAAPSPHRDAGFLHHKQQFSCREGTRRVWWGLYWNSFIPQKKVLDLGHKNPTGAVGDGVTLYRSGQSKVQDQVLSISLLQRPAGPSPLLPSNYHSWPCTCSSEMLPWFYQFYLTQKSWLLLHSPHLFLADSPVCRLIKLCGLLSCPASWSMSFLRWTCSLYLAISALSELHYQRDLLELCAEVCRIHISHKNSKDCIIIQSPLLYPMQRKGPHLSMCSCLLGSGSQADSMRLWGWLKAGVILSSSPRSSSSPNSEEPHRTGRKLMTPTQMKTKEAVRTRLVSQPGIVPPFCPMIDPPLNASKFKTGRIKY